jgi:hypothetical protein
MTKFGEPASQCGADLSGANDAYLHDDSSVLANDVMNTCGDRCAIQAAE